MTPAMPRARLRLPVWLAVAALLVLLPMSQAAGPSYALALRVVLAEVPLVGALWLAAAGLGWPIVRLLAPRTRSPFVLPVGAGLATLLLLDWLLAWAGLLGGWTAWGHCVLGWLLLTARLARPLLHRLRAEGEWPAPSWAAWLGLPAVGVMLVACACPPGTLWRVEAFGYDALTYHLQLPREWLELGRMRGLPHNVYSFLPSLVEAGYMQIGAMRGAMHEGIYAAQLFHASAAAFAALAIGRLVRAAAGRGAKGTLAGGVAAAAFLATPWTVITGSLAYDEMFVLSLGAAAFVAAFDAAPDDPRAAVLAGFLAGAATLAKLPAGPMIALPVGAVVATRAAWARRAAPCPDITDPVSSSVDSASKPSHSHGWALRVPRLFHPSLVDTGARRLLRSLAPPVAALLAGALTLAPFLVRNAAATGNPVFPFAAETLGRAHWSEAEVKRWRAAHGPDAAWADRLRALPAQWLFNTGYGGVGGSARPDDGPADSRPAAMADFGPRRGVPVLWLMAAAGAALGFRGPRTRPLAAAMLGTLAIQVVFWLGWTHLQSRFLTPTLLPGAALAGLAWARPAGVEDPATARHSPLGRLPAWPWLPPAAAVACLAALTATTWSAFEGQGRPGLPAAAGAGTLPPLVKMRTPPANGFYHPISGLPPGSRTLMVADAGGLLYIQRPVLYHAAFDPEPLGAILRMAGGDPRAATRALRESGITHVWAGWSELERLHRTYSYDPGVTVKSVADLARGGGWRVVEDFPGVATLFALPGER